MGSRSHSPPLSLTCDPPYRKILITPGPEQRFFFQFPSSMQSWPSGHIFSQCVFGLLCPMFHQPPPPVVFRRLGSFHPALPGLLPAPGIFPSRQEFTLFTFYNSPFRCHPCQHLFSLLFLWRGFVHGYHSPTELVRRTQVILKMPSPSRCQFFQSQELF